MHYFDYNATTPLFPEAKLAWIEASEQHWLNPSSPYRAAAGVHARLEEARARLAELMGLAPERVVFNSGATEGNHAVFETWACQLDLDARVAVGTTEHPSVLEPARRHFSGRINWCLPDSPLQQTDLEKPGFGSVSALSVMAANNETGLLHPWQEWVELCRERNIPMHCDASQWIGKMPLRGLAACDYVTGCGHKFGGPKGVGFLLVPEGSCIRPHGGGQEGGRRAGTENLASILAMVVALEVAESRRESCSAGAKEHFLRLLREAIPEVEVVAEGQPQLWNTVSIIMPDFQSVRWIRMLEKKGFLVSAGSACSSGQEGSSHVLTAMGIEAGRSGRVLRLSSGWQTTVEDWQVLLDALVESRKALQSEAFGSRSKVITL